VSCSSDFESGFSEWVQGGRFIFLGGAGYYFTTRAVFVCAAACQWLAILKNSWHGTKIIQEKNKKK